MENGTLLVYWGSVSTKPCANSHKLKFTKLLKRNLLFFYNLHNRISIPDFLAFHGNSIGRLVHGCQMMKHQSTQFFFSV